MSEQQTDFGEEVDIYYHNNYFPGAVPLATGSDWEQMTFSEWHGSVYPAFTFMPPDHYLICDAVINKDIHGKIEIEHISHAKDK